MEDACYQTAIATAPTHTPSQRACAVSSAFAGPLDQAL